MNPSQSALELQSTVAKEAAGGCSVPVLYARRNRESGSVMVVTLLAFAAVAATFMYVALIGSRAAETSRLRNAADATAMASATVKAKVMNYESFIVLADSILLPLVQVSDNIRGAQVAAEAICVGAALLEWSLAKYCIDYAEHMEETNVNRDEVSRTVNGWVDGLEQTGMLLDTYGPVWAEYVASRTGMDDSYQGQHGVTVAAAYPIPKSPQEGRPPPTPDRCNDLGIRWVDSNQEVEGDKDNDRRNVCHGMWDGALELAYLATSGDVGSIVLDGLGMTVTGNMLPLGAKCSKAAWVPSLNHDTWLRTRVSRGMALAQQPSDRLFKGYLESLRHTEPPRTLQTGWLLGMGCAEHYAQEHYGHESFWHMDWRARLVPCEYAKEESRSDIRECAMPGLGNLLANPVKVPLIAAQFERELALQVAEHWRY